MINSLVDLVNQAAARIRQDQRVDAGLDALVDQVSALGATGNAVEHAASLLRTRAKALKEAGRVIEELGAAIGDLADTHRFTAEHWPQLKADVEAAFGNGPDVGLREWLDEWYAATAGRRIEAMARLHDVSDMPAGAELLLERCMTTRVALEFWRGQAAAGVLEQGGEGFTVAVEQVPGRKEVRRKLRLLRIRLALEERQLDEAERLIQREIEHSPSPGVKALRARLLRSRGEIGSARAVLAEAAAGSPTDLDVSHEAIAFAQIDAHVELGLATARGAMDALPLDTDLASAVAGLGQIPPAELWIAAAERLLDRPAIDEAAVDQAVEKATYAAHGQDPVVQASIAELRVRLAELRNRPPAERVSRLVEAGAQRVLANQLDQAIALFRRARRIRRTDPEVNLRLADCLITRASTRPLSKGTGDLVQGLQLIGDAQRRGQIGTENAWSYLSEAGARQRLAGALDGERLSHVWLSFQAVCRSLALEPEDIRNWTDLSGAAQMAGVYRYAVWATSYAVEQSPDDLTVRAQHAQALANDGQFEESLALVGDPGDTWSLAVRGYLLLRSNRAAEALPLLQSLPPDLSWGWVDECLLLSLLMTGKVDEAIAQARVIGKRWASRLDEVDGVSIAALGSLVLGEFEEAGLQADRMGAVTRDPYAARLKAMACYLRGDRALARATLDQSIAATWIVRDLHDWPNLYGPALKLLAGHYRVKLPALGWADRAIAAQTRRLVRRSGPVAELRSTLVPGHELEEGAIARDMGEAVWNVARGQFGRARKLIEHSQARHPDHAGLEDLRRGIDRMQRDAGRRQVAARLVDDVRSDRATAARAALHRLVVGLDAGAAAGYVVDAIGDDPELRTVILEVLRPEGQSTKQKVRATVTHLESVLAAGEPPQPARETPIQVILPPSWFKDSTDPLRQHPLFLRYLPELRNREMAFGLARIAVRTDETLEPDGYQVLIDGEHAATGLVDPGRRYGSREAFELLGQGESVEWDADLALHHIPEAAAAQLGPFGALLTMAPAEVVTRRLADATRTAVRTAAGLTDEESPAPSGTPRRSRRRQGTSGPAGRDD